MSTRKCPKRKVNVPEPDFFETSHHRSETDQALYDRIDDPELKEYIANNALMVDPATQTKEERWRRKLKKHKEEEQWEETRRNMMLRGVEANEMKNKILSDLVKAINRVVDEMVLSPESTSKSITQAKNDFNENKQ